MSTPDAPTKTALGAQVVRPAFLAYLDFVGDPVRATTWEVSLQPASTGDADLDGHLFTAISPQFGSVGAVKRQTGGTDTVTATLSGIVGPDSDLLNLLGDETMWKGRVARLWFILKDETGANIGAFVPYYTGRMVDYSIDMAGDTQTVSLLIETYLAVLTDASNSTYLNQSKFNPGSSSAALTIAVANGARSAPSNATLRGLQ
jgi:hypothetical protein